MVSSKPNEDGENEEDITRGNEEQFMQSKNDENVDDSNIDVDLGFAKLAVDQGSVDNH